jgi:aprataxin
VLLYLAPVQAVARDRITALKAAEPGLQFRCGFHAVPSLLQLHMHVISQVRGSKRLRPQGVAERLRVPGCHPALLLANRCLPSQTCALHARWPPLQDLNSTGLKHKKHWNSFASAFFLDAEWVLAQLRSPEGRLRYSPHDKEALLKGELRCHRCGSPQANMPRLKAHIAACTAPLSQGRLY